VSKEDSPRHRIKAGKDAVSETTRVSIKFRGKDVSILRNPQSPLSALEPLFFGLLALEDDRVDAIFRSCGVLIRDADGKVVFPD
jgi:hypothetical protein